MLRSPIYEAICSLLPTNTNIRTYCTKRNFNHNVQSDEKFHTLEKTDRPKYIKFLLSYKIRNTSK